MALSVRSSSLTAPSCPNPVVRSPAKPPTQLNHFGKSDLEGLVKILKNTSEVKRILKSEKMSSLPFEIEEAASTSQSLLSKPSSSLLNPREGTLVIGQGVSGHDNIGQQNIFGIQRTISSTHPAKAFFMANALMLSMPFEALAETCEADSSFFNMPILLVVALIGATVGGLLARQRKGELLKLNNQLRQINSALRRQAKIESYAPSLSYAPVGARIAEDEVIVDSRKHDLISWLKSGKNLLRNQDPEKAFVEFKTALELAQDLKDPVDEKKAARGLGASLQRQGKYKDAINYHSMVLEISRRVGENSGNTEAYGAIADCYTELGDLEKAGTFYDKYIVALGSE